MNSELSDASYRVYVLTNAKGRLYIGVSGDVAHRLDQHNQGLSKWTRGKGPWILQWTSTQRSLGEALSLENLMKRQKGGAGLQTLMHLHNSTGSSSRGRPTPSSRSNADRLTPKAVKHSFTR